MPENAVEKYRVGFEAGGERGDSRSEVVDFGSEVGDIGSEVGGIDTDRGESSVKLCQGDCQEERVS